MKINSDLVNAENTYNHSTTHTYSCEYMNELGTPINFFGNIGGTSNSKSSDEAVELYAHCMATKLGTNNVWRIDIDGRLKVTNGSSNNYVWGIRPDLISDLFYQAWRKHLSNDNLHYRDMWYCIPTQDDINNNRMINNSVEFYGYGSAFRYETYNGISYLAPARYYTKDGNTGSWASDQFQNHHHFLATIYLREID